MKCNHLNYIVYKYLQGCNEPWYCLSCTTMLFPFGNLNNQKFLGFVNNNNDNNNESKISNSYLILKPPPDPALFNQFNNVIPENNSDPENMIQNKYCDIDELQQLEIPNKEKSLSFFHINSCSLNKNFEELQNLLQSTNSQFDVIAITETRIMKNTSVTQNIELSNYSFEHTPTESSAGGTLLYIANHLSYKTRSDLNIYKKFELESTFIEIINPKKSNIIVGAIFRHPKMDVTEFNNILNNLLKKINQEQKTVFLLGDFNIDLMHYNEHKPTNEFLDSLASNSYLPYIIQPSRHTSHSRTLIDNIFSNVISKDIISGNITATISDHLPQFLISPNTFADPPSNKSSVFEKDWSNFDHENFVLDYCDIDWPNVLKLDEKNVNLETNNFLDTINSELNKYAPLKKS